MSLEFPGSMIYVHIRSLSVQSSSHVPEPWTHLGRTRGRSSPFTLARSGGVPPVHCRSRGGRCPELTV